MLSKCSITIIAFTFCSFFSQTSMPRWNFDQQLKDYFQTKVTELSQGNLLTDWENEDEFNAVQKQAREQLWDMLGMNPQPERSDLKVRVTGVVEHEHFIVEKIVFESMPGLYVTGNLYRPKIIKQPLPAILYVCGHATVEKDGYNYGAKANYQHHPAWYARNGYVCLILDTVQLGEIEGIHHGTYRYNRWWWLSRGYTPAGIEAWNGIRAIDYLITREDVDEGRIGLTGRSGGGATSWWVGALDERVKVVIPVAGITDLQNHVVDGCVEGHCDCMYFVNTYQWDFAKLGLLIAPRPLLIANADQDAIFPLDGVYRTYREIKKVYEKLNIPELIALNIVGGGHHDVQEIRIHPFRWFNHFLLHNDELIEIPAKKWLQPEDLRVFDQLPKDQINTKIDSFFVPVATSWMDQMQSTSFETNQQVWMEQLKRYVFAGWPKSPVGNSVTKLEEIQAENLLLTIYSINSEANIELPLLSIQNLDDSRSSGEMQIIDDGNWQDLEPALTRLFGKNELWAKEGLGDELAIRLKNEIKKKGQIIFLPIRGSGIARYSGDDRALTHIRRRYYLLGQTLEGMQTWDILQGIKVTNDLMPQIRSLRASNSTSIMLAYASLYSGSTNTLYLESPGSTHDRGPSYINVRKYLDIPQVLLMTSTTNDLYIASSKGFDELRQFVKTQPQFKIHF
ncbi:MAG: acetylxylan esterase [Saprospiraceae bacterium]|nr:acetylxylan esterase [Saprospiraceae bacterium]